MSRGVGRTTPSPQPAAPVRVAELMACLSVATDLGMGRPPDYAVTTCVAAMRLGEALGFGTATMRDVYYESLLRYIGANADTHWFASLYGDELLFRAEYSQLDLRRDGLAVRDLIQRSIRRAAESSDAANVEEAMARGLSELPGILGVFMPGHCEVAQRLSERMGFTRSFVDTVGQMYARWDGTGVPQLKEDAISPALLCVSLAHEAVTFHRLGGIDAATRMARERSGGAHDPRMVEVFSAQAGSLLGGLDTPPRWEDVLALEPKAHLTLDDDGLDAALEAVADFSDIKSPWFLGHSRAVSELAARAGRMLGLPDDDVRLLKRAGFVHDIGKVGISAGIWGKAKRLSDGEWESVRLHPYHTGRVFARSAALNPIGELASLHHERLDGRGYYRALPAVLLPLTARVLAVANRYRALVESRAHRPALTPAQAARELRTAAGQHTLDKDAVDAVLAAAGDRQARRDRPPSNSLSEREVEVLRLLARGMTMKATADLLNVAYKTIDRHVQNIYTKIGVGTRAGATLWAVEHGMI